MKRLILAALMNGLIGGAEQGGLGKSPTEHQYFTVRIALQCAYEN